MSNAVTGDESVEDYLEHADFLDTVECAALRGVVMDSVEPDALDYEDWATPLKLSGGRLCLREIGRYHDETIYYTCEGDRMRAVAIENDGTHGKTWARDPPEAVNWLRDALEDPDNLSVVLRERTPFEPLDGGYDCCDDTEPVTEKPAPERSDRTVTWCKSCGETLEEE